MNGLPYYKAYPRDFIEGTIGMPFELKGAYRLVLDLIYMQGGSLPDDARYISGLLGCSVRKWNSFRQELIARGKLQVSGESLTNYRAVIELETLAKVQEKQSQNASRPRKNNNLAEPRLNHTEPDTDTDKKETPKPPKGGSSPTPKQPIRQAKNPMGWPADGWERFWLIYPNKVGKADARKAFDRAQARASIPFEALIAGLEAYVSKTDDRPWCNPSTWLNQDRWEDRPATGPPRRQTPPRRGDPMMDLAFELHGARHDRDRPDHTAEPEILPPERDASGDRRFARSDDVAARTPARQSVHDRGGSGTW